MAYCKSCGAYIPDGQTICLACGFDESAQQAAEEAAQKAAAAKAAQQSRNESMRDVLERHRQLQKEKNRQWAEKEKERRERQEQNRQWAQEEYARRQAKREVDAEEQRLEEQKPQGEGGEQQGRDETTRSILGENGSLKGNVALAALSYLSVFFVVPYLVMPQDDFAMYHAKQGLRLFIFSAVADLVGKFVPFGWLLSLLRLYGIYKGISAVMRGKKEPLPYIGTIGMNK